VLQPQPQRLNANGGNVQVPAFHAPAKPADDRPAPAGAIRPTIVTTIPPDFRAVDESWGTIPAGQWPKALRPDSDVKVIYADGRVSGVRAVQSVIWEHRGTVDDVVAFQLLGNDTIIPMG
jgi:hypothetical protein